MITAFKFCFQTHLAPLPRGAGAAGSCGQDPGSAANQPTLGKAQLIHRSLSHETPCESGNFRSGSTILDCGSGK